MMLSKQQQQRRRWFSTTIVAYCIYAAIIIVACCSTPTTEAFQMMKMAADYNQYKPPVKSSVKKLHGDRRIASSSSSTTTSTRNSDYYYNSRPRSSSKSAHAGALSVPRTEQRQSFEQRMRNLVVGTAQRARKQPSASSRAVALPHNVRTIESLQDYKAIVGDEREKVVAVRFYATYCRACKAVAPHFYHLAKQYPHVLFVDVPVTDKNAALHQGLGIPCLPYAHIYTPDNGLVEELKFTRKDVASFKEKLGSYVVTSSSSM